MAHHGSQQVINRGEKKTSEGVSNTSRGEDKMYTRMGQLTQELVASPGLQLIGDEGGGRKCG